MIIICACEEIRAADEALLHALNPVLMSVSSVAALLYRVPDGVFVRGVGENGAASVSSGMDRHPVHLHARGGEDTRGLCVRSDV